LCDLHTDVDYKGMAVQVEPMQPMLKAPGTKRLKLKYDVPLSNFAVNFSLRVAPLHKGHDMIFGHGGSDAAKAGPHTRYFISSAQFMPLVPKPTQVIAT